MRRILVFVTLCSAVLALPKLAHAFEDPLGIIVNTDAGAGLSPPSNLTTAAPFRIPALVPITVQPTADSWVCVESTANWDAGTALSDGGCCSSWAQYKTPSCRQSDGGSFGVFVTANTAFPSSCGASRALAMADGGFSSCVVSCVPASGASTSCYVSRRQANSSPPEF